MTETSSNCSKMSVSNLCSAHLARITRCKFLQPLRHLCQFMYLTTVKLVLRNSFDLNYLRKMCGTWVSNATGRWEYLGWQSVAKSGMAACKSQQPRWLRPGMARRFVTLLAASTPRFSDFSRLFPAPAFRAMDPQIGARHRRRTPRFTGERTVVR
jgi:hypothetical protein